MSGIIDFYFDYSSPYGYLASERIEAIAGRYNKQVIWRSILLGAVFKVTKQAPLTHFPLKGDYAMKDFNRSAREHKIAYQHPDPFPIATVAASRATIWLRDHKDPALSSKTADFVHGVFRAYYQHGQDITDGSVLSSIANSAGIDVDAMTEALAQQSVKDALRAEVDSAIETGIFGSPMMIVDGEPFWGHDRLEQFENWLKTGGW